MRKKRRTSRGSRRSSFKSVMSPRKKRRTSNFQISEFGGFLKVAGFLLVLASLVVGIFYLEKYVRGRAADSAGSGVLEIVDPPAWVNDVLKRKIYIAATAGGEDLKLDEDAARSVQRNIVTYTAWLADVRVQTMEKSIRIYGRWRKPIGFVRWAGRDYYVDAENVVLDYVEVTGLPIVRIEGLSPVGSGPAIGVVWEKEDLAAAMAILDKLDKRDELEGPGGGLLGEIKRINVTNYNGGRDSTAPHIVMYSADNTQIIWGAELGKWQRYMEASDEEKIASLYSYYKEKGSLGGVKYIRICDPQQRIPLPIDKY